MLDTVHDDAFKICLGVFRFSSVQSLITEIGERSLSYYYDFMNIIYDTSL